MNKYYWASLAVLITGLLLTVASYGRSVNNGYVLPTEQCGINEFHCNFYNCPDTSNKNTGYQFSHGYPLSYYNSKVYVPVTCLDGLENKGILNSSFDTAHFVADWAIWTAFAGLPIAALYVWKRRSA